MKAYPKYKDSGIEWLGEVPETWNILNLKHCVKNIVKKSIDEHADCIALENIESHTGRRIDTSLDPMGTDSIEFMQGDVLYCKLRPYLNKVFFTHSSGRCSSEFFVLRQQEIVNNFLYYYMLSENFCTQVNSATYGVKMPRANWNFVGNICIPIPSDVEQLVIATFLDREAARIDALIQKKERMIELLKEKRIALITQAVTKGLDPNTKMKDSGIEWLGEVPEHWEVLPVKHIVQIPVTDGPHETPEILDEGVPFISAESIKCGKIDFELKRGYISREDHSRYSMKYFPSLHDIYIIKSGATTGNSAMVETDMEFNIWSPLAVIRCNVSIALPRFVYHYVNSKEFTTAIQLYWSFGTQQNIGMNVIENLSVPLPPLNEQDSIVSYVDGELKQFEKIQGCLSKSITLLREYRSSLIHSAVTGKIDLRDTYEEL